MDIEYVDDPFEEPVYKKKKRRPLWQIPETQFQKDFLNAINRQYFRSRDERHALRDIEKNMKPLGEFSAYPKEWVYFCLDWARKKWDEGKPIQFIGLLSFIKDNDKKMSIIASKFKDKLSDNSDKLDPYSRSEKWR